MIVKFNKPFNVLSQFSDNSENATKRGNLSDFISIPNIYPVGRLDKDSEGLLLLSDDGKLQHKLSNPTNKIKKTYNVQVEGEPKQSDLNLLRAGIELKDGITRPAEVKIIEAPYLWERAAHHVMALRWVGAGVFEAAPQAGQRSAPVGMEG